MKEKREIKIQYRSGEVDKRFTDHEDDYKDYTHSYIMASTNHVKRFNNALMILMGIDGCERNLMDWLADNMTNGNYVTNNFITRKSFIDFHKKYRKPTDANSYSDKTVTIAFQKLTSVGLLISVTRGLFMVNPEYYYAGEQAERINAIKMVMEFKAGVDTKLSTDVNLSKKKKI